MAPARDVARLLKVLSVEARVRIVELLKGGPLCVNGLAARLDVTQGAVSQHLRVMRDAGLVIDDKRGHFVHYRLNERTLAAWREAVKELLAPPGRHADARRSARQDKEGTPPCAAAARRTGKAAGSRRA